MAGIILAAAGAVLILAATAGFVVVYRMLSRKKLLIRDEIDKMKG